MSQSLTLKKLKEFPKANNYNNIELFRGKKIQFLDSSIFISRSAPSIHIDKIENMAKFWKLLPFHDKDEKMDKK